MGLFDRTLRKKDPTIFEQISDLLSGKGIKFERVGAELQLFKFEANVDERLIRCMLDCDTNRSLLTFSAFLPFQMPNDKIGQCLELMARFNEKIWYGGFQFSFEYNVVSLVTTLPVDNAYISYEQLERLCFNNLLNMHYFQIGFERLLKNDIKFEKLYSDLIAHYQNSGQ